MFDSVALPLEQISSTLLIRHALTHCVYDRLGVLEVQFLARQEPRLLPVLIDGQLRILPWGNRRGDSSRLPCTLWTSLATVEAGGWGEAQIAEAVMPAPLGFDSGIWLAVKSGVRGLDIADENGARIYPILQPARNYYTVMTKAEWMPCLVRQVLDCNTNGVLDGLVVAPTFPSKTTPERCRLLFGAYRIPVFKYGDVVICGRAGQVELCGLSAGRIPWPLGRCGKAKALVLCGDLARAVRLEAVVTVSYW